MENKPLEIELDHAAVIEMDNYNPVVGQHEATKFKYTAFQFVFPGATAGNFIITKSTKGQWNPKKDIKRIIIQWR